MTNEEPCSNCYVYKQREDLWEPKDRTDFSTQYTKIKVEGKWIKLTNLSEGSDEIHLDCIEIPNMYLACKKALGKSK